MRRGTGSVQRLLELWQRGCKGVKQSLPDCMRRCTACAVEHTGTEPTCFHQGLGTFTRRDMYLPKFVLAKHCLALENDSFRAA